MESEEKRESKLREGETWNKFKANNEWMYLENNEKEKGILKKNYRMRETKQEK